MYKLLEFLRSISIFMLFIIMEGVAIAFYAHSDSYTQAKLLGYSSSVTGGVSGVARGIGDYFSLRRDNDMLLQRIVVLEQQLDHYRQAMSDSMLLAHSTIDEQGVEYHAAHVVSNSINRQYNYLMIDRGYHTGIREGMAVVTPNNEIVGRVIRCAQYYSIVMSVLNRDFRTSGVLANGNYAGSLYWEGRNRYQLRMDDVSKYADIEEGLAVKTAGFSHIFPSGVLVGHVVGYALNSLQTSYSVDIELAVDMSTIDEVLVVNNRRMAEGMQLMSDFESGVTADFNIDKN
ncbi:MAG: rod shape-determining protein MreC [Rikenellaceae bacterium]